MTFFPHFRPLVPIIETLRDSNGWSDDDFGTIFHEFFANAGTLFLLT